MSHIRETVDEVAFELTFKTPILLGDDCLYQKKNKNISYNQTLEISVRMKDVTDTEIYTSGG